MEFVGLPRFFLIYISNNTIKKDGAIPSIFAIREVGVEKTEDMWYTEYVKEGSKNS